MEPVRLELERGALRLRLTAPAAQAAKAIEAVKTLLEPESLGFDIPFFDGPDFSPQLRGHPRFAELEPWLRQPGALRRAEVPAVEVYEEERRSLRKRTEPDWEAWNRARQGILHSITRKRIERAIIHVSTSAEGRARLADQLRGSLPEVPTETLYTERQGWVLVELYLIGRNLEHTDMSDRW